MKLSLRSKLLLLILPLLAVLAFLFFTALLPYQRVKSDINDLRPDVSKTIALGDLGIVLSRQMMEYFKLIASGGAEDRFQEARNNTQQSLERLRKEMAMHTGSEQDAEASQAVEEIAGQYAELNRLCQTGLELAKSDQRDKALNLIKTKIEPLLEDSLRIKFEQLDAKNGSEFEEDLARLRGHSDDLITFSRGDLQSNITNMKGHITDTLLVFALARHFDRQMEEYYFLILAQNGGVGEIEAARRTTFQALESWKINEGGGVGQRTTASKDLADVENVKRELIKLNQLGDSIPELARRGETAQALHLLTDKIEPIAHGQLADILGESVRHEGQALTASLDNAIKSSSRMQFGLGVFSLLVLVIGLGTPWLVSRTLISPILELKKAASKVGSGDLDTKVSVTSKGELSQLATTFNQMTQALKESRDSLHEANRELEQKVSDRTDELKTSNEQLQAELVKRKLKEAALGDSEKKYRNIFENAGEGIFQTTPQGRYIAANPAMAHMHGFDSPEELISSLRDISRQVYVDPARREEFKSLLEKHGVVRGFEHQIFRKDGSKIWVAINARAVRDARGAILYYEGTTQGINERKLAEAKGAVFATLARKLSGARTPLDAGGIIAQTAGDLFGWDSCNLDLYDAERDLVHPMLNVDTIDGKQTDITASISDRKPTAKSRRVIAYGPELLLREEPIQFDTDAIPFGDKTRPSASIMTVPIQYADKVVGLLSVQSYTVHRYDSAALDDLQALADHCGEALNRIRAEEALRESEERYRDLVENSRELICTHDLDGRVLSANRAAAEALGYDSNELLEGKNIRDILAPEVRDEFEPYMERLRERGATSGVMLVETGTGERRVWEYYNSLRTEGVDAPIVRGMARDITERKRAEDDLRESESFRRTIVESEPECVKLVAPDYTLLDMNPAGLSMIGAVSKEQVVGCSVLSLIAPEWHDTFKQMHERVCQGESVVAEFEIVGLAGVCRWMETHAAPLRDRESNVIAQLAITRDITERKRAEESLQLFRNLIDQSNDAIEVIDPITFRFIDCNESAYRSLGYSREEFLSLTLFDIDPGVDRSMIARLDGQLKESSFATFESLHLRKDGTTFPVEINVKLVRLERDYRLAVVRDITGRKHAEEALREREARLSAIYSAAPVGIGVDVNRVIQEVNDTMCRITGYSREELIGQNSRFLFLTQEDYESVGREKDRVIAELLCKSIMARLKRKDGRIIDVLLNAVPLDAANLSQGATFTVLDITERKHAEEALRESEERYRELFENAKDAIYVHDLSGRYISVNHAAEKLVGYTRDEILGKHYSNFVAPSHLQYVRKNLCKKLDVESETIYEVLVITKDRRRVPVEVSSRSIYENGVVVAVQGTARDITDRKRAQEALRIYSQRLIQAQEAERQKIARELHDEIGQVLTAVRINLQSIQRSCRTADCVPLLDESIGIVDEALGCVRELSIELRPSLLDDLGLTSALRWYVDRYARRTGIIVEVLDGFKEDGRLPRELETACFRIAQEALTNVARHAQAGSVSVQLERSRERMLLTIIDDGVGFDIDKLRKSASAAAALGLRGMEERALGLGGHLEIDSGLERGTRIRATFPLKRR